MGPCNSVASLAVARAANDSNRLRSRMARSSKGIAVAGESNSTASTVGWLAEPVGTRSDDALIVSLSITRLIGTASESAATRLIAKFLNQTPGWNSSG